MFTEIFVEAKAKKIKMADLPKTIPGGEYDDEMTLYSYDKKRGSYEYTQIEPDEDGDYGDEDEEYNQGYTLECKVKVDKGIIYLDTEVLDLGRPDHKSFGKKYSNLEFDDVKTFTKQIEKIIKEFDKL